MSTAQVNRDGEELGMLPGEVGRTMQNAEWDLGEGGSLPPGRQAGISAAPSSSWDRAHGWHEAPAGQAAWVLGGGIGAAWRKSKGWVPKKIK